ncbi:hypothetical protein H2199_006411 [Coniosporium tulheliwenetii]|uniref:Uncharacterized protein n=1 Tax=Coniosporium tulheliwenetii TaxID=3383036 RepID=A0ACC2YWM1_9PEZI|nr:hypothetical protein H2199_006411 [Cladosporium sp. JES 115]
MDVVAGDSVREDEMQLYATIVLQGGAELGRHWEPPACRSVVIPNLSSLLQHHYLTYRRRRLAHNSQDGLPLQNHDFLSKFVGTFSLGLLTGLSYTLATHSAPSLLALPTATHCARSFLYLQTTAKRHLRLLSAVTVTSLSLAFIISPRAGGTPVDYVLRHDEDGLKSVVGEEGERAEAEVNGEEVRGAVERFGFAEKVRTGVSGVAFAMAVVGIWGMGFRVPGRG